ncbi:MAG: 50S ribosomal protein L6 [Candidatus Thermoplasmatota archaeon]|nr:50S ribosomal protein L6 [Candidatus Thermoplasmatota archaeon]
MPIAAFIEKTAKIPEGTTANISGNVLTVKGPKGTLTREFKHPNLSMDVKDDKILTRCEFPRVKDKALVGTWNAHVKNMLKGVSKGFIYHMKLVYSHFPVKVSVKGDQVVIENFSGEKSPRQATILEGVKVNAKGDQITVEGIDKELVGQTMANIERATIIRGYDRRVFQDGIYLTGKE